jgi:transposase
MPYFVGLDASKHSTQICVVDANGQPVDERTVETEPRAIVAALRGEGRRYRRVGMESWSMTPWLYEWLAKAGLPVICVEVYHASRVLKAARRNKTDRNDARGIAELMRIGAYKTVHVKTPESQQLKALLTARRLLKIKATDLENAINSALLIHGMKFKKGYAGTFERRVRRAIGNDDFVLGLIEPLLTVRRTVLEEFARFETRLHQFVLQDPTCRLLMTAPGIGAISALAYRVAIDEPRRFHSSRDVAAHLGLTPRVHESGPRRRVGSITKSGDAEARAMLFMAARSQFRRCAKPSWLKTWGEEVAARRGKKVAMVAMARRLAMILHAMWVTETEFRWAAAETETRSLA